MANTNRLAKEFYNAFWREELSKGLEIEARCRHNTVVAAIPPKVRLRERARILDLGCGKGDLAVRLAEYGEVTAIDFSTEAIAIAQKRYPHINFVCAHFFDISIEEACYDLIVSSEVIEHLSKEEQGSYLELIYRSLAEGGYLILTTPNKRVARALGRRGNQPIENWLAIDELKSLLAEHFKILRVYTTYFEPIRYRIRNNYRLYFQLVEPVFRRTKSGLYTVILAQGHGI